MTLSHFYFYSKTASSEPKAVRKLYPNWFSKCSDMLFSDILELFVGRFRGLLVQCCLHCYDFSGIFVSIIKSAIERGFLHGLTFYREKEERELKQKIEEERRRMQEENERLEKEIK